MTETVIDGIVAIDRPGFRARVSYGGIANVWTLKRIRDNEYVRETVVVRKPI